MSNKTSFSTFGFEHSEGWDKISKSAIAVITALGGTVLQVKEKFGGLRIYFAGPPAGPEDIWDGLYLLVAGAEWKASHTCECCGDDEWDWVGERCVYHAQLRRDLGWIRTLCDKCHSINLNAKTPLPRRTNGTTLSN